MDNKKLYTEREDKVNAYTHLFGIVIAFVAGVLMQIRAYEAGNIGASISFLVFTIGMLICMTASTTYHFAQNPVKKKVLRNYDHGAIYVLIAASYSPFCVLLLDVVGYWLLGFVWLVALLGIYLSSGEMKKNNNLKTASYVLMGCIVFAVMHPLWTTCQTKDCMDVIFWLMLGGVFYVIGAVIYALAKHEFVHAIFHVFVVFGMVSHIIGVLSIPLS